VRALVARARTSAQSEGQLRLSRSIILVSGEGLCYHTLFSFSLSLSLLFVPVNLRLGSGAGQPGNLATHYVGGMSGGSSTAAAGNDDYDDRGPGKFWGRSALEYRGTPNGDGGWRRSAEMYIAGLGSKVEEEVRGPRLFRFIVRGSEASRACRKVSVVDL